MFLNCVLMELHNANQEIMVTTILVKKIDKNQHFGRIPNAR